MLNLKNRKHDASFTKSTTYLGYGSVTVSPFTEMSCSRTEVLLDRSYTWLLCPSDREAEGVLPLVKKKAGSLGGRSSMPSLVSMNTAADMSGLSSGSTWTHSRPTWMHRVA